MRDKTILANLYIKIIAWIKAIKYKNSKQLLTKPSKAKPDPKFMESGMTLNFPASPSTKIIKRIP